MDCSPSGSSVHGIFQARRLEWVAIHFSRGSSQPRDQTQVMCTAHGLLYCRQILYWMSHQFSSVQFSLVNQSCLTLCDPMDRSMPGFPIHHQLPEFTQTHVHPAISSSVVAFCSHFQSFPASGSFQMSRFFPSGDQSIGVSASTSVLPVNSQDWSSLGWTGWISLQSKGLSRVFSNTTVQKHQFFVAQLSSQSNSHIHTWPVEKP